MYQINEGPLLFKTFHKHKYKHKRTYVERIWECTVSFVETEMATPSLSQASLFQPKPSLLNPNTLQNQNANSRLFAHHNHLSITLPLKTRNGLVSYPKASLTVQPNDNSTVPIKKCDSPIIVIDNYDSFTYNLCQVPPQFLLFLFFPFGLVFLCLESDDEWHLLLLFFTSEGCVCGTIESNIFVYIIYIFVFLYVFIVWWKQMNEFLSIMKGLWFLNSICTSLETTYNGL